MLYGMALAGAMFVRCSWMGAKQFWSDSSTGIFPRCGNRVPVVPLYATLDTLQPLT